MGADRPLTGTTTGEQPRNTRMTRKEELWQLVQRREFEDREVFFSGLRRAGTTDRNTGRFAVNGKRFVVGVYIRVFRVIRGW